MRQKGGALLLAAVFGMSGFFYQSTPTGDTPPSKGTGAVVSSTQNTPKEPAPNKETPPVLPLGAATTSCPKVLDLWNDFLPSTAAKDNNNVTSVLAIAPDPIHTQLSLYSDRTLETIQAAAQDEQYVYDSSWLPWKSEANNYSSKADETREENERQTQEACPGLILFRDSRSSSDSADAYENGLAVFVIGDEPTRGINAAEWRNAVALTKNLMPRQMTAKTLNVLGPTFSGSLVSLKRLLAEVSTAEFSTARVYSGAVWSCDSIARFQSAERIRGASTISTEFGVFSENSERQIYRFLMYLRSQHQSLTDVAILSEDETAYGGSDTAESSTPCYFDYGPKDAPVWLFYPRDISAVRLAYLSQSVFSAGSRLNVQGSTVRTVLRPTVEQKSSPRQDDTIPVYSEDELPLDEEARLYELVSFLRSHHTHYFVLRCSNPDDFLFLTRFFHHAYPDGRIITLGSDELFRREVDTSEFRGVMALTNYPLLPREQHWSRLTDQSDLGRHVHRIFSADTIEAEYLAGRFIFDRSLMTQTPKSVGSEPWSHQQYPYFLLFDRFKENIPDYVEPIWLHSQRPTDSSDICHSLNQCYEPTSIDGFSPSTWLVVVGRDGNWPVAVLNDTMYGDNNTQTTRGEADSADRGEGPNSPNPPRSTLTRVGAIAVLGHNPEHKVPVTYYWPTTGRDTPIPWRIALLAITALALFHAAGLWKWVLFPGGKLLFMGRRIRLIIFRPSSSLRKQILLGISTSIMFCDAILLLLPCWRSHSWKLNYSVPELWIITIALSLILIAVCCAFFCNQYHRSSALPILGWTLAAWTAWVWPFTGQANQTDDFSLLYRDIHLTSGVSPFLPVLLLSAALYLVTLLSIRRFNLLLLSPVRLPRSGSRRGDRAVYDTLKLPAIAAGGVGPLPGRMYRISLRYGCQIDRLMKPFSGLGLIGLPILIAMAAASWLFRANVMSMLAALQTCGNTIIAKRARSLS